ncbi:MAG: hypothetical protein RIR18_1116 [Pseudomonadota bacterium]|jgi:subtilisin-like proprotein convertase family protein/subtilisin family serine protease
MADSITGNTSSTTTLSVGSSASSIIDFNGDTDWFKVALKYGYQYQVWVEGWSNGNGTLVDPYLAVYNSVGVFQLGADDISLYNKDAAITTTPSSTGTFFLGVSEYGNNATGTYKVTLWQDQLASTATAATIANNSGTTDRIGWQSDTSDWYSVYLTAGTNYQFDLLGSSGDGALSGLTLADPWLALRNGSGLALVVNDDSGLGNNSRIYYTPTTSGTYYLDAEESGANGYGIYRLVVNSTPVVSAITLGSSTSGVIGFSDDVNLYSVKLTAGQTYAFAANAGTLIDPYLEILDSTGSTVAFDDDSGSGLSAYTTYTPTTSGTYFLEVRSSQSKSTGTYTATAWQLPTVSIANANVTEGNSATTNLVFTLTLSSPSSTAVSVGVNTSGTSTATVSVDYIPTGSTVTFAAGVTTATFTVPVIGDTIFEPTEALHVLLSNPNGVVLGKSDAYGNIFDNDQPYQLPPDTYLTYQWYLYPTTGIDVFPVWRDYTGAGVRVAVFDQGIDPIHPDLDGNLLTRLGRKATNLSVGGDPILSTDNHGTAVAGVIAAERNGTGIVGVTYGAHLVSIYDGMTTAEIPNAFSYASNFDVLNDSWGFAPQGASYYALWGNWAFADNFLTPAFSAAGTALANLAATGRNGLGTVVVQSAGNSFELGDDTNLHNFQNSQYIITVAATDYAGNVTSYSSPGASVLVAAPGGGGTDLLSDVITTDRVGAVGNDTSDYTSIAGTSFSAPIVSGVVALMLEANPKLGYRDVQEILAYSARKIASSTNDWAYNGATNWNGGGLHYDSIYHNLCYGLVDATAAVRLAETWGNSSHTAANRQQISTTHSPALVIPDNSTSGASDSINVTQAIDVERVEVTLNITHPFVGDLSVGLVSPSGTVSILLLRPQQNALSAYGTGQNDIHFTFDTVLDWGESSVGNWGVFIADWASGDVGRLNSWTLNLIGKTSSADDTYIYTDEYAESCTDQSGRSVLTDTTGTDTLNASACTGNLLLDLRAGSNSIIDGRALTIAAGSIIENAFGGDGNDSIIGNSVNNTLWGMRGNDTLTGGSGNDVFCFNAGINCGTDLITDFSVGDTIKIEGVTFAVNGISLGNGTSVAAGQVQLSTSGNLTTFYVGRDNTVGADLTLQLLGQFQANQFTLAGNQIQLIGDVNQAPTLIKSIANQKATEGVLFSFSLPAGVFTDSDKGDALTLSASNLPSWLAFDAKAGKFSGTPGYAASGSDTVTLTATDKGGLSKSTTFSIATADTSKIMGTAMADTIEAGAGNDSISGGAGNDMLIGGAGLDALTGGDGADTFVFDALAATSLDQITDFLSGTDRLSFSVKAFAKLKGMTAGNLLVGAVALDANDYLIFNPNDSKLYYDADGSGSKSAAVAVCELVGVSSLTVADVVIS